MHALCTATSPYAYAYFVWYNLTLLLLFLAAAQNRFENFLVCGVVVLALDEGMDLVVLGYDSQMDIKSAVVSCELLCFELHCNSTKFRHLGKSPHHTCLLYHLACITKRRDCMTHQRKKARTSYCQKDTSIFNAGSII